MSIANEKEPAPVQGHGDMWYSAIVFTSILHGDTDIIQDMKDRREFGIQKYGVPLQCHNGRDGLVDAYQEALDMIVYLTQVSNENLYNDDYIDSINIIRESIVDSAVTLKRLINERS